MDSEWEQQREQAWATVKAPAWAALMEEKWEPSSGCVKEPRKVEWLDSKLLQRMSAAKPVITAGKK